ncbi:STAS/SEC14 domain-containing protein [Litoribacillus peritrichatus]|uniref:STAS/SEC14 domain-containing protein n=1 Tax=Litoribacillus peritrichatus TaxID=718191 RepID=A0ABP7M2W7_9GAMM
MSTQRHGLSIGLERTNEVILLNLKVLGKLTHDDYTKIIPMLDAAVEGIEHPYINVFVDASELEGWELRAAWDDLKLGMKHGNEFARIAIYGNKKWQDYAAKVGSWFISGDIKYFEEMEQAQKWLQEEKQKLW